MDRAENATPRLEWPAIAPRQGFRGIYINLERAADRRQQIEIELRKFELEDAYIRLPAIDGRLLNQKQAFSPYVEACFRSHAAAVELAQSAEGPVHIMEDDSRLSHHLAPFFAEARDAGLLDAFDVVFLDMWIEPNLEQVERWEKLYRESLAGAMASPPSFRVQEMTGFPCRAASSYAVSPRGAQKLYGHMRTELDRGPSTPVDRYIGGLGTDGRLKVGVVVPFLTGVDPAAGSTSTIQLRMRPGVIQSLLLMRSAFFIDTDVQTEIIPTLDVAIKATGNEIFAGLRRLLATRPDG